MYVCCDCGPSKNKTKRGLTVARYVNTRPGVKTTWERGQERGVSILVKIHLAHRIIWPTSYSLSSIYTEGHDSIFRPRSL